MAKITWLGEDTDGVAGPSFTTCFDRKFSKGEPVEVTNPDTIKRARKSRFFKVSGDEPASTPAADASDDLDDLKIAELRERADAAGIDHDGMSKAELRAALRGNVDGPHES